MEHWRHNKSTTKGSERGEVDVFLHPVMATGGGCHFVNKMPRVKKVKGKDGEERMKLVWESFTSPEDEHTNKSVNLRDKVTDLPRFPALMNPFLLLREWLRAEVKAGRLNPNTVVFRWTDPDPKAETKVIEWSAKLLADLIDSQARQRSEWGIRLVPKREEVLVVVLAGDPAKGPLLTRERGALIDSMVADIQFHRAEATQYDGDPLLGDPFANPFAFKWVFDNTLQGTDKYNAKKCGAPNNVAVQKALEAEAPDPSEYARVRSGDKTRIRESMLAGCLLDDVPWDAIFVDAWDCPDPTDFDPAKLEAEAAAQAQGTQEQGTHEQAHDEGDQGGGEQGHPMATYSTEVQVLSSDLTPCDEECGAWLHPQWAKCPQCGKDWEVTHPAGPVDVPHHAWLVKHGWYGIVAEPQVVGTDEASTRCWSCSREIPPEAKVCPHDDCGQDQNLDTTY